jgi:hypothetical protein
MCGLFIISQNIFAFGPFNSKPYLTPTSSPTNSIYINWNTVTEESTIVAYGTTAAIADTFRLNDVFFYHHAHITNLTPNTEYYYRVLPSGDLKQFRTFPTHCDTFTFLAFGDTRTDSAAHQSVINRMATCDFSFYTHTGDLVGYGDSTLCWQTFFNIEDTLLQSKHFQPAIGNRETPYWQYDTLFALPDSEDYYSMNYGNTHCISLNTQMDLYGSQRDWLINDLAIASNDTSIDWIFVSLHRPPYSSGYHGNQMDVRNAWCPVFETYAVDIVFCSHDHDYERTIPINGVIYIVTGGGGAPLYPVGYSLFTAFSLSTHHFCHVSITDKKLLMQAIKPDGTVFDTLFIDKTTGIDENTISKTAILLQINPNPFNTTTKVTFSMAHGAESIELQIYDVTGRLVKDFRATPDALRTTQISWDGRDQADRKLPSGGYFLKLVTGDYSATEKLLLIR